MTTRTQLFDKGGTATIFNLRPGIYELATSNLDTEIERKVDLTNGDAQVTLEAQAQYEVRIGMVHGPDDGGRFELGGTRCRRQARVIPAAVKRTGLLCAGSCRRVSFGCRPTLTRGYLEKLVVDGKKLALEAGCWTCETEGRTKPTDGIRGQLQRRYKEK